MLWIYLNNQGDVGCSVNVGNRIRQGNAFDVFVVLEGMQTEPSTQQWELEDIGYLKPFASAFTYVYEEGDPDISEEAFTLGNPSQANAYFQSGTSYKGYKVRIPADATTFNGNGGHIGLSLLMRSGGGGQFAATADVFVEATYGKQAQPLTASDYATLIGLYQAGNVFNLGPQPNADFIDRYYGQTTAVYFSVDDTSYLVFTAFDQELGQTSQYELYFENGAYISKYRIYEVVGDTGSWSEWQEMGINQIDSITTAPITGGTRITITQSDGDITVFDVMNGADGKGITEIVKSATAGLVDTYTIKYTDGSTSTFTVTNGAKGDIGPQGPQGPTGNGISSIAKTGTSGLVDTYTITMTNGSTATFQVTNGSNISTITKTGTSGLTDTYTVTLTNGQTTTFQVTNGRGVVSVTKTGTSGLTDTYTIAYNDGTTSTFAIVNGANGLSGKGLKLSDTMAGNSAAFLAFVNQIGRENIVSLQDVSGNQYQLDYVLTGTAPNVTVTRVDAYSGNGTLSQGFTFNCRILYNDESDVIGIVDAGYASSESDALQLISDTMNTLDTLSIVKVTVTSTMGSLYYYGFGYNLYSHYYPLQIFSNVGGEPLYGYAQYFNNAWIISQDSSVITLNASTLYSAIYTVISSSLKGEVEFKFPNTDDSNRIWTLKKIDSTHVSIESPYGNSTFVLYNGHNNYYPAFTSRTVGDGDSSYGSTIDALNGLKAYYVTIPEEFRDQVIYKVSVMGNKADVYVMQAFVSNGTVTYMEVLIPLASMSRYKFSSSTGTWTKFSGSEVGYISINDSEDDENGSLTADQVEQANRPICFIKYTNGDGEVSMFVSYYGTTDRYFYSFVTNTKESGEPAGSEWAFRFKQARIILRDINDASNATWQFNDDEDVGVDETPTEDSTHLVTSGGVHSAIETASAALDAKISKNAEDIAAMTEALIKKDLYETQESTFLGMTAVPAGAMVKAYLDGFKGNSAVVNQLVQNGNFADGTTGWSAIETGLLSASSGVLTVQARAAYDGARIQVPNCIVGHKYLVYFTASNDKRWVYQVGGVETRFSSSSSAIVVFGIVQATTTSPNLNFFSDESGTSTLTLRNVMLIDLTAVPLTSTEMADVATAKAALKPKGMDVDYYIPYNLGTLTDSKPTKLISRGYNLFDEEYLVGYYDGSTGVYVSASGQLCSKNYIKVFGGQSYTCDLGNNSTYWRVCWYDKNHGFISSTAQSGGASVQAPSNAWFAQFGFGSVYGGTYHNDVCFHLASASLGYKPHVPPIEYDLTIPTLKSAGSVQDESKAGGEKAGKVDLSSGVWLTSGSKKYAKLAINPKFPAYGSTPNAICSKYEVRSMYAVWEQQVAGCLAINNTVDASVMNVAITTSETPSGVLNYELATPTNFSDPISYPEIFDVYAGGSVEVVGEGCDATTKVYFYVEA